MELLIFYVGLALIVSFLCSIMEAVLLSITPSFVAECMDRPGPMGQRLKHYKEEIDRPLSAILTLNTIAHTVGAAGAGAQAVRVFGEAWTGLFAAVLTLLILFLSEIIPKTLGAVHWRELAGPTTRLVGATVWLLYPLVVVAQGLTRLLTPKERRLRISQREFLALTDVGVADGVINEQQSVVMKNLLRVGSIQAADIMTPRVVMQVLPEDATVGMSREHNALRFSRIPIHTPGNPDAITGHVLKDEVLLQSARDQHDLPLVQLKRKLIVVPPSVSLPDLFERLLDQSEQLALVVDEYGDVQGLVTMEDMIETILGREIVDEADSVEDMRRLAKEHWQRRARRLGLIAGE